MHTSPLTTTASHVGRRSLLTGAAAALGGVSLVRLAGPAAAAPADTGAVGTRQSPIDIVRRQTTERPAAPPLVVDYPRSTSLRLEYVRRDSGAAGCSVRRADETVEAVGFSSPASVRRDGERYRLVNTHFHIASEHTVDGVSFAMEQHFVHQRVSDGTLLVVGVLLVDGGESAQDALLATLPRECGEEVHRDGIDLDTMLPRGLSSWNYAGSLTTPDYDEGVIWHVLREPQPISAATVRRFRRLFPSGDARELQPRNGRPVLVVPGRRA